MITSSEKKTPIQKRIWKIGNKTVVIIDSEIVEKMRLNEDMFLEQELVEDGILMRINRIWSEK